MRLLAAILLALPLAAATPGPAAISRELRQLGIDPQECYRVRDLKIDRDEGRLFLNEGLLAFFKPVGGRRLGAVFSAEVEAGDAEILVIPPTRGERLSLANFTKSPNLDEHFRNALFLFTDDSAEDLLAAIRASESGLRKAPEEGFMLATKWDSVVRNIADSFEVRLIDDLLAGRKGADGFFFAAIAGQQLGNFDFIFDPRARSQITLGQLATRNERTFYDLWAHFPSRRFRDSRGKGPNLEMKVEQYRIEARLNADLHLDVVTRMRVVPLTSSPSLVFEISPRMKVTAAEIDGAAAELFRRDSIRSNLLRGDLNEAFLIFSPSGIEAGRPCELTIHHDGDLIVDAGNKVYFVASRINWYPQRGIQFASYDLIFRHPRHLTLVASGDLLEERVEGDERITHRRPPVPVRYAGFNLGDYAKTSLSRGGYRVDVYANRRLESALEPRPIASIPSPVYPRRRLPEPMPVPPPAPSPEDRIERMAGEIAEELEWMAQRFGPPPLKTLAVSPIPGQFGQGFPGLLYLSTLSYIDSNPRTALQRESQTFFGELLHAHETAHQWWGNSVTSAGYEDDWIQEAIANYTALAILEKRRGAKTLESTMADFRERMLQKDSEGRTAESAGPITQGLRLQSSQMPGAWRTIVYDKGAWIVHMLRRRMGDDLFWPMLAEIASRFQRRGLTTDQFRAVAAEFLAKQTAREAYRNVDPKFESFFDTWTQGTGVPSLKLQWSTKGAAPKVTLTATVTQAEVSEDFSDLVPIDIQLARGRSVTRWIRTASEPVTFTTVLPSIPVKVTLDPLNATLKR